MPYHSGITHDKISTKGKSPKNKSTVKSIWYKLPIMKMDQASNWYITKLDMYYCNWFTINAQEHTRTAERLGVVCQVGRLHPVI